MFLRICESLKDMVQQNCEATPPATPPTTPPTTPPATPPATPLPPLESYIRLSFSNYGMDYDCYCYHHNHHWRGRTLNLERL